MGDLSIADFAPRRGGEVGVESADGSLDLVLVAVEELPGSLRAAGGFRLEFRGPPDRRLGQGIHRFRLDGETHDIFIVPIGAAAGQLRYEAIFF
jgi:hypothetical protein